MAFSHENFNDDIFEVESFMGIEHTIESLIPVTEGYVGRTKETQIIEDNCAALCKKWKDASIAKVSMADIHNSKEIRNIEAAIEKLTGFRKVDIVVFNKTQVNAYTMPRSMLVRCAENRMPTMPTAHGKRYYDESHQYYCYIALYAQIFVELLPEEATALILHEVGHNFDHTITFWMFDMYFWAMSLPSAPLGPIMAYLRTEVRAGIDTIVKVLDYIPIVPLAKNYFMETMKIFGMILGPLGAATTIANILNAVANNPSGAIMGGLQVHQETFADSYVTSLGYGDAMIHAINKWDTVNYTTKHGALIEAWTGSGSAAAALMLMFVDPHPEHQSRARKILDDMKNVSEDKNVPPKMRAVIKADYARAKKAYDDFLQVDPDERNAVCTRFARKMKEACFGGKVDFRVLILSLLNAESAVQGR